MSGFVKDLVEKKGWSLERPVFVFVFFPRTSLGKIGLVEKEIGHLRGSQTQESDFMTRRSFLRASHLSSCQGERDPLGSSHPSLLLSSSPLTPRSQTLLS